MTGLVYLDSSALVKVVVPEPESGALWGALAQWPERVSSALARVELLRAVHRARAGAAAVRRAEAVLDRIGLVPVDDTVLHAAARLRPWPLRSTRSFLFANSTWSGFCARSPSE